MSIHNLNKHPNPVLRWYGNTLTTLAFWLLKASKEYADTYTIIGEEGSTEWRIAAE